MKKFEICWVQWRKFYESLLKIWGAAVLLMIQTAVLKCCN